MRSLARSFTVDACASTRAVGPLNLGVYYLPPPSAPTITQAVGSAVESLRSLERKKKLEEEKKRKGESAQSLEVANSLLSDFNSSEMKKTQRSGAGAAKQRARAVRALQLAWRGKRRERQQKQKTSDQQQVAYDITMRLEVEQRYARRDVTGKRTHRASRSESQMLQLLQSTAFAPSAEQAAVSVGNALEAVGGSAKGGHVEQVGGSPRSERVRVTTAGD